MLNKKVKYSLYFQIKKIILNTMSGKTKQKKMADYITTTVDNSKKRARNNDENNSESKKPKSGQVDLNEINFDCEKKNAKDLTWNLKIVSWNVAGLRAWLKVINYIKII